MKASSMITSAGLHGPLRVYTSTSKSSAIETQEMIIDDNPVFGDLKMYSAPPAVAVKVYKDPSDTSNKYSSHTSKHIVEVLIGDQMMEK